ncbi:MAG: hypothetical protein ACT4PU_11865 [Planctomycetota bacterium]
MKAALVLGAALLLPGCGAALYSQTRFDAGQDPAEIESLLATAPQLGTKREVLTQLGAPQEIVALADGELFVYRLRHTALDILNVHSGLVGLPRFPIYLDVRGRQTDGLLLLRFDRQGRLLDAPAPPASAAGASGSAAQEAVSR